MEVRNRAGLKAPLCPKNDALIFVEERVREPASITEFKTGDIVSQSEQRMQKRMDKTYNCHNPAPSRAQRPCMTSANLQNIVIARNYAHKNRDI